jgi:hypothetical protein
MKLSEFPEEINKFSLELQKEIEARDEFLDHKKAADIAIASSGAAKVVGKC